MTKFDKIEVYFDKKGVNVSYNTLAGNDLLMRTYVKDFQEIVNNVNEKRSEYVKYECYKTLYDLEKRPKYTGFEKVKKLDLVFREKIKSSIHDEVWQHTKDQLRSENSLVLDINYKTALSFKVREFKNPFLYLSGGLDSELLALTFIENEIEFKPVIFKYFDKNNICINDFDTVYAFKFCKKFNLTPIVKNLNIEELWESQEFAERAKECLIPSPHLNTHIEMIEIIEREFSGVDHIFGGEVRFYANRKNEDNEPLNLIYLAKASPLVGAGTWVTTAASLGNAQTYMTYSNFGCYTACGQAGTVAGCGGGAYFQGAWYTPWTNNSSYYACYLAGYNRFCLTSTLDSSSSVGSIGTEVKWQIESDNNGLNSPSVGTTCSIYITTPSSYTVGPWTYADGSGSPASVCNTYTVTLHTVCGSPSPTPPPAVIASVTGTITLCSDSSV